ncbi:hypothetical protein FA13DRAFT_1733417 [Coprinellus micaceus]|uniref:Uncharacterized protein n=1 Tax=Coprinellus micaceus TaxID=71717 RepID=A0A4Y7TAD2_COPMI|nr:hypothetical protein FA13DRAFT_1733417 [Coprinellus micaceus]
MSSPTENAQDFAKLYGHFPPVYRPHDFAERGARSKWRTAMQKSLPALYLPAGLELREGSHYQPPRFDFGWKLTTEEVTSICQQQGLRAADFVGSDPARLPAQTTLNNNLKLSHPDAPSIRIDTILAGEATPSICITLTDNHRAGNARPFTRSIQAVKGFLGLEEAREPGWYLDSRWSHWQWQSSDGFKLTNSGRTSQEGGW